MIENLVWALIIVTGTASVNVSTGYPNKALCEDAISIAKTGLTVAEKQADDQKIKLARIRADQEFQEAHPPRPATDEDKKKCSRADKKGIVGFSGMSNCVVDIDTNITSFTRESMISYSTGYIIDAAREIKYAKCVMINPTEQ